MTKKIFVALIACVPSLAFAHPGHGSGFVAAFVHPFTGIDHLLMMLCVGIVAGRIGGNARWQLPLAFLSAMTVGWLIGAAGYTFAGIESGIAAGLIALGVLLSWRIALPTVAQAGIVAMFALLHGMAHGVELAGSAPVATSIGFLCAGALLHATGLLIAALIPREKQGVYRVVGIALAVVGGGLLAA